MKVRKDLVIAVLVTFLMSMVIFAVLPSIKAWKLESKRRVTHLLFVMGEKKGLSWILRDFD